MSRRVLPYRVPADNIVEADDWMLVLGDDEVAMPEAVPDWDYQMDLTVKRSIRIHAARARVEARLPKDALLNLAVVWTATGSNLRAPATRVVVEVEDDQLVQVELQLRGQDLGGVLTLDTVLVLAESLVGGSPIAPRRAGAVLWSDQSSIRLQGDAPQFPIAVIDFAKTSFPGDAGWHLQVSGGLHAATMGSLLLLVNEQNEPATTALKNAAKPRTIDKAILSVIYADVARIMIEHALRDDDFEDGASFAEESLGATFMNLFEQLFPGSTITDLRLKLQQYPSHFASAMQAAVQIFKDV